MGIQVRIDKSLVDVLENLRACVAIDIKQRYGLDKVTISGTLASKILAAQMLGKKTMQFKIHKTGPKEGILDLM